MCPPPPKKRGFHDIPTFWKLNQVKWWENPSTCFFATPDSSSGVDMSMLQKRNPKIRFGSRFLRNSGFPSRRCRITKMRLIDWIENYKKWRRNSMIKRNVRWFNRTFCLGKRFFWGDFFCVLCGCWSLRKIMTWGWGCEKPGSMDPKSSNHQLRWEGILLKFRRVYSALFATNFSATPPTKPLKHQLFLKWEHENGVGLTCLHFCRLWKITTIVSKWAHSIKLTARFWKNTSKNRGWETILSFLALGLFSEARSEVFSFREGISHVCQQILCRDADKLLQLLLDSYLEPQTTSLNWMFGETTIFMYIMIWNHPVETTIKSCLFGVPGRNLGGLGRGSFFHQLGWAKSFGFLGTGSLELQGPFRPEEIGQIAAPFFFLQKQTGFLKKIPTDPERNIPKRYPKMQIWKDLINRWLRVWGMFQGSVGISFASFGVARIAFLFITLLLHPFSLTFFLTQVTRRETPPWVP